MINNWANKSVLILGGLGGIGNGIAKQLIPHGLQNLGIIDVAASPKNVENVQPVYRQAFVDDENGLKRAMDEVATELKGLDIIINSAGISVETQRSKMIAVNFGGVVNSTFAGIELLRKDKGGRGGVIMNVSSIAGLYPEFSIPIYCGTKFAVLGLTQSLSADKVFHEKTGISFVTICPGVTDTKMIRPKKEWSVLPEMWEALRRNDPGNVVQPISIVGECVVKSLEKVENGAVWVCANNKIRKETLVYTKI